MLPAENQKKTTEKQSLKTPCQSQPKPSQPTAFIFDPNRASQPRSEETSKNINKKVLLGSGAR
jgi:hypothetical protein